MQQKPVRNYYFLKNTHFYEIKIVTEALTSTVNFDALSRILSDFSGDRADCFESPEFLALLEIGAFSFLKCLTFRRRIQNTIKNICV